MQKSCTQTAFADDAVNQSKQGVSLEIILGYLCLPLRTLWILLGSFIPFTHWDFSGPKEGQLGTTESSKYLVGNQRSIFNLTSPIF